MVWCVGCFCFRAKKGVKAFRVVHIREREKEGIFVGNIIIIIIIIMDDDDDGGKAPKSNADFRAYLRSKEDEKAKTTEEDDDGRVCDDDGGQNRRWQRRTTNRRKKREREEEENDFGGVVPKYRDRARERRETMEKDVEDAEEKEGGTMNEREYATRGVFESEEGPETNKDARVLDIEKSKYMGGDEKSTHKVKGLDFALLRKTREELEKRKKRDGENDGEDDEQDDDDDENENENEKHDDDDDDDDDDDAQKRNANPSFEWSSIYDAKSNLGRALVTKLETAQKRRKDALLKRKKLPPLSGVSYVYDINARMREITRTVKMETKPRADIEEERKARRREFAKISKEEEKILRAVAQAIREPRAMEEEGRKGSTNKTVAIDSKSNPAEEGEKIATKADSDSEDIFADVGKDYDAIAEMEKEQAQIGEQATKKESRKVLFDGEALAEVETGPRKADENIKKMDEAYERKRLEERAELEDDAYGEFYPGFDAGFGGEIDDDDDDDGDKDKEAGEEGGKKGKKGKKELTEAQKMKQKENKEYQAMQKHMKQKYSDKYDSAFGVVSEKKKNEDNDNAKEKEAAGGKRAKRLKI